MITELTGLQVANASLLDEATAAAEAMMMSYAARSSQDASKYFVANSCHPQVMELVKTRAEPVGVKVVIGETADFHPTNEFFGALFQYPRTDGGFVDYKSLIAKSKEHSLVTTLTCDILGLVVLESPAALGADIAVVSSQRFGVPMGFGGPHAAFIATTDEHKRRMPGRIVGVSKDKEGRNAYRLALQTREQHIRREKATSNICTAQALLAIMASMYACYHGPEGLRQIAERVNAAACLFAAGVKKRGLKLVAEEFFDTVSVLVSQEQRSLILKNAESFEINLRMDIDGAIAVTFDETITESDLCDLLKVFGVGESLEAIAVNAKTSIPDALKRTSKPLFHSVFSRFKSETDLMRYIKGLETKDLSLTSSMIPLGSCTMKLNAAVELFPVTWPEFGSLHPFVPSAQAVGYKEMFEMLEVFEIPCEH
jgi:glycine dehydrogenase